MLRELATVRLDRLLLDLRLDPLLLAFGLDVGVAGLLATVRMTFEVLVAVLVSARHAASLPDRCRRQTSRDDGSILQLCRRSDVERMRLGR